MLDFELRIKTIPHTLVVLIPSARTLPGTDAAFRDTIQFADSSLDATFRQMTQTRFVHKIEGVVGEWKLKHIAEDILLQELVGRVGVDVCVVFNAPGLHAEGSKILEGQA